MHGGYAIVTNGRAVVSIPRPASQQGGQGRENREEEQRGRRERCKRGERRGRCADADTADQSSLLQRRASGAAPESSYEQHRTAVEATEAVGGAVSFPPSIACVTLPACGQTNRRRCRRRLCRTPTPPFHPPSLPRKHPLGGSRLAGRGVLEFLFLSVAGRGSRPVANVVTVMSVLSGRGRLGSSNARQRTCHGTRARRPWPSWQASGARRAVWGGGWFAVAVTVTAVGKGHHEAG